MATPSTTRPSGVVCMMWVSTCDCVCVCEREREREREREKERERQRERACVYFLFILLACFNTMVYIYLASICAMDPHSALYITMPNLPTSCRKLELKPETTTHKLLSNFITCLSMEVIVPEQPILVGLPVFNLRDNSLYRSLKGVYP